MIHTVTVNPALDLTYRIPALKFDDTIRAAKVYRAAGGKGINVSRVVARLNHATVAMGFAGGRAGEEIEELLHQERVRTWFTRQQAATRTNVILQDDEGHQVRVSGPGATPSADEVALLKASIFELRAPDFLVLSGSLLKGMDENFYCDLIERAHREGIKVAADADGEQLRQMVEAGVDVIKPNRFELARLVGREVGSDDEVATASREALTKGVRVVLASLGGDGAMLVTEREAWKAIPPKIEVDSAVGAGDSMLAGALLARAEGADWADVLRLGVACGTATATTPGTELCHLETVRAILPQVELRRLA
jgi:1-phosphofructokinase family hexose kinase